ncbi:hypothetical protein Patl1_33936 [Pistacia atlantica]|uniref:Uncharacterized protein n=1 Tax=Pistacia atlantica TaxID=434234 RepID=A0ACC0ZX96_9ROSI|nr:hypothetical protein Patl1_33936 [Pistacia atlantica]
MFGGQKKLLVLELCMVVIVQVIVTISDSKLAAADNKHSEMKLASDPSVTHICGYQCFSFRYPVDIYDRFWTPLNFSDSIVISTQSTIYTQSLDDGYKIPAEVLKTAGKSQNASIPLSLYFDDPLDSSTQCYVYFHFTEIEKLKEGQKRELRIELNGERNLTESISLEYLKPTTIAPNNPPINGSRLHFSIYAAEGSNFSPILNAVEAFVLVELPLSPTNLNDGISLLICCSRLRIS